MTTDDILDMIEASANRSAQMIFGMMGTTWSRNGEEIERSDEAAVNASAQLRSDIARLWKAEVCKIGERVRSTYTSDHPLYSRFNHVVAIALDDIKSSYLHTFFRAAFELAKYVPARAPVLPPVSYDDGLPDF